MKLSLLLLILAFFSRNLVSGYESFFTPMFDTADVLAVVYTFLPQPGQKSLRGTCRAALQAFNHSVQLGFVVTDIGCFGSTTIENWTADPSLQWFPIVPFALHKDPLSSQPQRPTCSMAMPSAEAWAVCDSSGRWATLEVENLKICHAVEIIPSDWLAHCRTVATLRIEHVPNLRMIGTRMVHSAERLTHIRLKHLVGLVKIGSDFAVQCPSLVDVRLEGLPNLVDIGTRFVAGCNSLEHLVLQGLPKLQTIDHFLAWDCKTLRSIVLKDLPSLQIVKAYFADECISLEVITLETLPRLKQIGDTFASRCTSLCRVVLDGLPGLETIGGQFALCTGLKHFTLCDLPSLVGINELFLTKSDCEEITLQHLPKLITIGRFFANTCQQLSKVCLADLPSLKTIGGCFASDCLVLTSIVLEELPSLSVIEEGMALKSPMATVAAQNTPLLSHEIIQRLSLMGRRSQTC